MRYALLIGANHGDADEAPLRYAESDARRVGEVLRRLGRFPAERLVLLLDPDVDGIEAALADLRARIAASSSATGDESLLFVYYSGHADARAIHTRGARLPFAELRRRLDAIPAAVRVVVMDACRSGGLTRVKGAEPTEPFVIEVEDRLRGEGLAIITSSAETEDAQESDRLRGSFFTHHFVAGLRGAADTTADRRVTLAEAYGYAYTETIRSTSRTRVVQHPTYAFEIRGRHDVVLTTLDDAARGLGTLALDREGDYVLFAGGESGALVAEVAASGAVELALEPGEYLVRRRGAHAVHEGLVTVGEGRTSRLPGYLMRRLPYGRIVRKGLDRGPRSAWSLLAGAGVSYPVVADTGAVVLGVVGGQLDLEPLTLQARFRYGYSSSTNDVLELEQHLLGGDLGLLKLFDVGPLALGFGVRLGGDRVLQRFSTRGVAPDRSAALWRGGALLHAVWSPLPWFSLFTEFAAEASLFRGREANGTAESWNARVTPQGYAGIQLYLE